MHTWLATAQARGETQRLQLAAASQAADAGKDASGRGEGAMACDDEFDSCAVLAAMDDTSGSPAEPGQTRQRPPPPVESQSSCSLQAVAATAAPQNPRAPSPCRLPACKNFCVCQVLGAASQGKGAGAKSPPPNDIYHAAWACLGTFVAMMVLSVVNQKILVAQQINLSAMSPMFASLATLIYAAPASPFGQPKMNVIGHVLALIVANCVGKLSPKNAVTHPKP